MRPAYVLILFEALLLTACRIDSAEFDLRLAGCSNGSGVYAPLASGGTQLVGTVTRYMFDPSRPDAETPISIGRAESTNDAVAHVEILEATPGRQSSVVVTTGGAGHAEIVVYDQDGSEIGRKPIEVADPAKVVSLRGDVPLLAEGTDYFVVLYLQDAAGRNLLATGIAAWATGATSLADEKTPATSCSPSGVFYFRQGSGTGSITAQYGQLISSVQIEGAPVAAIDRVVLDSSHVTYSLSEAKVKYVDATAYVGQRLICGASCNWTTSDRALVVKSFAGCGFSSQITNEYHATSAGPYTATCKIGSATATLEVDAQ